MNPAVWNDSNLNSASPEQRTTREWAIANALSSVSARITQDNANRIEEYKQQWSDYEQNKLNHPNLNITAPVPAVEEVVVYNDFGWPEAGPGTKLVCTPFVYQAPKTNPSVLSLQAALVNEGPGASPFNSTVPLYIPVSAPDGSQ